MQYATTINDTAVYGITAARAAYNAALPATVKDGEADVPNPALIASDSAYLDFVLGRAVESWCKQYAPVVVPEVPPVVVDGVPQEIPMWQAQIGLARDGLLGPVEDFIATQSMEAQILWAKSGTVQRTAPLFAAAKAAFGWTEEYINGLFVRYSQIVQPS